MNAHFGIEHSLQVSPSPVDVNGIHLGGACRKQQRHSTPTFRRRKLLHAFIAPRDFFKKEWTLSPGRIILPIGYVTRG